MQKIKLGHSDLAVSRLAWGCWRLDDDDVGQTLEMLDTLLALGINFIDTAAVYGYGVAGGFGAAERQLGEALAARPGLREQFVIASKGGLDLPVPYNSTRERLLAECDDSLERLQIEQLDLYMIHRPDLLTPFEETADALNSLVASGKVREIGVSNFTPSQVAALSAFLERPLVCHQFELSAWQLAAFENGTLDQCQQQRMTAMAWSPLAGGELLRDSDDDDLLRLQQALDELAEKHACARADIALAFVLQAPNTVPIVGSQKRKRVRRAAAAAKIQLCRRDWYAIYEARMGRAMP